MKKLNFKETPQQFFERHPLACSEAQEWAKNFKTMGDVWKKCQRADWLLWWLRKEKAINQHQSVTLAVAFAKRVLKIYEKKYPEDSRPRDAIRAACAFLKSPSKKNRNAAATNAAYAATNAAYAAANAAASAAASAAYVATNAAYAATNAAYAAADAAASAAYVATNATYAAASAAYVATNATYAAASAAYATEQKWQANKVRKMFKYL